MRYPVCRFENQIRVLEFKQTRYNDVIMWYIFHAIIVERSMLDYDWTRCIFNRLCPSATFENSLFKSALPNLSFSQIESIPHCLEVTEQKQITTRPIIDQWWLLSFFAPGRRPRWICGSDALIIVGPENWCHQRLGKCFIHTLMTPIKFTDSLHRSEPWW
jgi:hypothetical protein